MGRIAIENEFDFTLGIELMLAFKVIIYLLSLELKVIIESTLTGWLSLVFPILYLGLNAIIKIAFMGYPARESSFGQNLIKERYNHR